ncbi:hypothetical protein C2G38_2186068 [Gigaspora rosea]|uniref:SWIM-type domain-containing protein n=1 Tax=Gigaspora rosea TaxID=44941 RepID=A0A397VF02_9GLOM|nr:hypothetical protein C2G38_2186068 [Gigaspora rosea]
MEIAKRFLCPGWETVDKDSICQLPNIDEYLVPSTKKESGLVYHVNSAIGTCNCFIGLTGAPCKHQGAVAMKYHIRIINFLPSITPNDRLNVKENSFYASLRTKPVLIDQHNTINDNKNDDTNAITIAKSGVDTNNEFSETDDQEPEFNDSFFTNFLKEIEDDYKNCGSQLQIAFDKFAERYKAAKLLSIGQDYYRKPSWISSFVTWTAY